MTYMRLTENPGPYEGVCESDHVECLSSPGILFAHPPDSHKTPKRFLAKPGRCWYSTPCSTETPATDPKQFIFKSKHVQEAL